MHSIAPPSQGQGLQEDWTAFLKGWTGNPLARIAKSQQQQQSTGADVLHLMIIVSRRRLDMGSAAL